MSPWSARWKKHLFVETLENDLKGCGGLSIELVVDSGDRDVGLGESVPTHLDKWRKMDTDCS